MSFEVKQKTISDKILNLVTKHPSAVSDYRKLIQYFWYYEDGLASYIPIERLERLSQPESISRAFRRLVADGKIVYDEETKRYRVAQEINYKNYYGGK